MPPIRLIQAFLDQATAQGSRSTVLRPLAWFVAICVAAVVCLVEVKAPVWLTAMFGVFAGLGSALYLGTFVYCLQNGKEDLLRSETYSIQKLAIEKGFVGDSLSGVIQLGTSGQDRPLGTAGESASQGDE
jgi:hypothetical protein